MCWVLSAECWVSTFCYQQLVQLCLVSRVVSRVSTDSSLHKLSVYTEMIQAKNITILRFILSLTLSSLLFSYNSDLLWILSIQKSECRCIEEWIGQSTISNKTPSVLSSVQLQDPSCEWSHKKQEWHPLEDEESLQPSQQGTCRLLQWSAKDVHKMDYEIPIK